MSAHSTCSLLDVTADGLGHWVQFCRGLSQNANAMAITAQPHVAPSTRWALGRFHTPVSALLSRPLSQRKDAHSAHPTRPKPHSRTAAEPEFRCGVCVTLGVHTCKRDTTRSWARTVQGLARWPRRHSPSTRRGCACVEGWRLAGAGRCSPGHDGLQWPVRAADSGRAQPLVQARAPHVLLAVLLRTPELPSPGLWASRSLVSLSERARGRGS